MKLISTIEIDLILNLIIKLSCDLIINDIEKAQNTIDALCKAFSEIKDRKDI